MKPGRESDKFVVRMPEGLRDHIKASANENFRSMNSEIIYRLEQSYQSETKKAEARA
jgi:predicted HicB family RNase H-like nuclease